MIRKLLVLTAALLVAASAFAADKPQTTCPTTGKPVDKTKFADVQGQRVYFCSSDCAARFKKDPEPVFAKLAKDGIVPESVQKIDPVCGMKSFDKNIKADSKGRRVYFCSDSCKKSFDKEPAKYLKVLDEKPASKS
jgi:YHS domain-containing protein